MATQPSQQKQGRNASSDSTYAGDPEKPIIGRRWRRRDMGTVEVVIAGARQRIVLHSANGSPPQWFSTSPQSGMGTLLLPRSISISNALPFRYEILRSNHTTRCPITHPALIATHRAIAGVR